MIGRPLRIDWRENDTPEALKEAYQSQTDVSIRTRVHLLWLVRGGWQIKAAAEAVGVHCRSAQRWVEWLQRWRHKRSCVAQDGRSGSAEVSERVSGKQTG